MSAADPRLADLTGPALELAKKAGFDAAVRLMVNFGGQRLYVPRKMRPRRPDRRPVLNGIDFVEALGPAAAKALAELYGGEHIEIPLGTALHDRQIAQQIANFRGSLNQAVRTFGLHRRTIQRVQRLHRIAEDGRQGVLLLDESVPHGRSRFTAAQGTRR